MAGSLPSCVPSAPLHVHSRKALISKVNKFEFKTTRYEFLTILHSKGSSLAAPSLLTRPVRPSLSPRTSRQPPPTSQPQPQPTSITTPATPSPPASPPLQRSTQHDHHASCRGAFPVLPWLPPPAMSPSLCRFPVAASADPPVAVGLRFWGRMEEWVGTGKGWRGIAREGES